MTNTSGMSAATVGAEALGVRSRRYSLGHWFGVIPGFGYLFLVYFIVALLVSDLDANVIVFGANYEVSWLRIINFLNILVVGAGAWSIARSSANKIGDVMLHVLVGVGYLVVWLFGVFTKVAIFNNSDFLMLMLSTWVLAFLAIYINAKTSQRSMGVVQEHDHLGN